MNPLQVYMCSPSWILLPPHTTPLGHPSAPAPSIQYRNELNLSWWCNSLFLNYYLGKVQPPKTLDISEHCFSVEAFVWLGSKENSGGYVMASGSPGGLSGSGRAAALWSPGLDWVQLLTAAQGACRLGFSPLQGFWAREAFGLFIESEEPSLMAPPAVHLLRA